jgi:hypothetical protein
LKVPIPIYVAGTLMFLVFALNLYVGLVDRNLFFPPNTVETPHYYFNWAIAIIDIVSSGILFLKPTKKQLVVLSGIVWPFVYIGAIAIDIESKLCIGAPSSTCFPTISAAENYLLFGSTSYMAVVYFWQYTFTLILVLLVAVLAFSLVGLYLFNKTKSSITPNMNQKKSEQDSPEKVTSRTEDSK